MILQVTSYRGGLPLGSSPEALLPDPAVSSALCQFGVDLPLPPASPRLCLSTESGECRLMLNLGKKERMDLLLICTPCAWQQPLLSELSPPPHGADSLLDL